MPKSSPCVDMPTSRRNTIRHCCPFSAALMAAPKVTTVGTTITACPIRNMRNAERHRPSPAARVQASMAELKTTTLASTDSLCRAQKKCNAQDHRWRSSPPTARATAPYTTTLSSAPCPRTSRSRFKAKRHSSPSAAALATTLQVTRSCDKPVAVILCASNTAAPHCKPLAQALAATFSTTISGSTARPVTVDSTQTACSQRQPFSNALTVAPCVNLLGSTSRTPISSMD
mmetsp:Transcript_83460/g.232820  ORF Transcript_83460/g.232820 Transcript_83460/m.232820 type:complete len:230 (-) Transcript_83460:1026-1715(-)